MSRRLTVRPVQIVQAGWLAFWLHVEETPIREEDLSGRISKIGDAFARTVLYEAANTVRTPPVKESGVNSRAMKLARRAATNKATAPLAHKIAAVSNRMPLRLWRYQHDLAADRRSATLA